MADLLLVSDRMQPQRLEEAGFEFRYPKLDQALQRVFN